MKAAKIGVAHDATGTVKDAARPILKENCLCLMRQMWNASGRKKVSLRAISGDLASPAFVV